MSLRVLMGCQNEAFGFTGPRQVRGLDLSAVLGVAALGRIRKYARGRTGRGHWGHNRGHQMSVALKRAIHNRADRKARRLRHAEAAS